MTTEINIRRTEIKVSFQKEGIHKYPGAKDLPGVEFLQYPHRHIFHFKVAIEVFHDDRDIEFIQFKRWLESLYAKGGTLELNHRSCEMIGEELANQIHTRYPNRSITISVAEDNENGATMTFNPVTEG